MELYLKVISYIYNLIEVDNFVCTHDNTGYGFSYLI